MARGTQNSKEHKCYEFLEWSADSRRQSAVTFVFSPLQFVFIPYTPTHIAASTARFLSSFVPLTPSLPHSLTLTPSLSHSLSLFGHPLPPLTASDMDEKHVSVQSHHLTQNAL